MNIEHFYHENKPIISEVYFFRHQKLTHTHHRKEESKNIPTDFKIGKWNIKYKTND